MVDETHENELNGNLQLTHDFRVEIIKQYSPTTRMLTIDVDVEM